MLAGWDVTKPDYAQPLSKGRVYERLDGKWIEKSLMQTNFRAKDIIYLETIKTL